MISGHLLMTNRSRALGILAAGLLLSLTSSHQRLAAQAVCSGNAIVCENEKPGTPPSVWDINGAGDPSIQGFATNISVIPGQVQQFKIDTNASNYTIDIYRMGYYGGAGARNVASITPSATLPQSQPACLTDAATGLFDCVNWAVSASWTVPSDSVSGIYFALLTRSDTGGQSHIFFIVRDDAGNSDLVFQTSDTTWQAYNEYGGNSLYVGGPGTNPGRAYKVSYNRPVTTRSTSPEDFVFNAEYPMVRFLESNGYDVSYISGVDTDRFGSTILSPTKHRAFLSVGHDEYWSSAQRANVEAARNLGMHLAFFSGNEIFWKIRWEASMGTSPTAYRTLVSYKETHANTVIDPEDPPTWTGTWRDPRFSPPADGGVPENALSGTWFKVNSGTSAITVPAALGKARFWRNTSIATLPAGATATLPVGTLGYEWDEEPNNGFRPAGLMRLSSTTVSPVQVLLDYGSTYGSGAATHNLTLYRYTTGGALVFGAGTIQWSWGLDSNHDRGNLAPDVRMQQATVNLFADMGVQPGSLQPGLVAATESTDATRPTSTITSPAAGASFAPGTAVTISGTAADGGGGIVAGVEVSTDGGTTWKQATGTTSWTFQWTAAGSGTVTILSRAFDDTGNFEAFGTGVNVTVLATPACPCTIWNSSTVPPAPIDDGDASSVELGMKFRSDVSGYVTGVRFYKGSLNTGTHTGSLWTSTGTLLATVTFTNETASGWQQANFASAIPIVANATYIVSYHAPVGHYTGTDPFFGTSGVDSPPLHALRDGTDGPNGVYLYGATTAFPTQTYNSENYWVDVVFDTIPPPETTPPTVTSVFPLNGSGSVDPAVTVTATFSEAMDPATISSSTTGSEGAPPGTFELRDPANNLINATVTYDSTTRVATLRPAVSLALSTIYTAIVKGGATDPRVKDLAGNAMATTMTWSFTTAAAPPPPVSCPCSIWGASATPPAPVDDNDTSSVELGMKFRSEVSGYVTGVRFYKASLNTGTHTGSLWSRTGTLLGSATFTGETASGWQQVNFASPVAITANTTYVVSYHAPVGHYTGTDTFFAAAGVDNPPLHALREGVDGSNGVYAYSSTTTFPTQTYNSENYWVDVVFNTTIGPDVTAPVVSSVSPANGLSGVSPTTSISATFNEALDASTITGSTFVLRDAANNAIAATVSYASAANRATLTPSAPLAYSTAYTATLRGGSTDPRVKDVAGNALAANYIWTFTTAAPPPPPPTEGPGGPVLVVTSATNPFSTYYAEILRTEGVNAFATSDLSQVSAASLSQYDLVILGEMPLTSAQVAMFTDWVNGGGNLVAMRPDKQLAGLLGLTDAGATLSDAYLLVNTAAGPGAGIANQTMQFHGTADRYTLNGATSIATLYATASTATANPAVTKRDVGSNGGTAAAFTYDLARSIVYTRQGNPAWSGQERDGLAPIRSDDLYYGARTGDVQPDWVDLNKVAIPQADEQQRLLWNIMLSANADRKPLPRFWYFPRMLKAVVIMTGDDHGNGGTSGRFDDYIANSAPGCSVAEWGCVRGTSYVYPGTPLSDAQVASYVAQGFEIALHVNTNCADWTPATLPGFYGSQLTQFASAWPSAPAPKTNRTHCIVWSDYATQPQVELNNGIRLDTTYYFWPSSWVQDRPGMFTGSGMPMRFTSIAGQMIDVYQAASQMTDESAQTYPKNIDTLLDNALGPQGYYGAFTANMHTDVVASADSDAIVASARTRGVPVVSASQMLDWLDGRNGSSFQSIAWNGNILSFTVAVGAGADGIQAMVPAAASGAPLFGITLNGSTVAHTVQTIKGIDYAIFAAQAGSYEVNYGADVTPPAISNVSATPSDTSVTIAWTTNEASDSIVNFGTAPGALTQSSGTGALVTSHSVTLSGLAPGTTYYYRATSADAANNRASSPAEPNSPAVVTTLAPSISIADASVTEGNSGTVSAIFTLTLSAASPQSVIVEYGTANGTASAPNDYVAATGTVTFAPGITQQTLPVTVNGDTTTEAHETFLVNLTNPANATLARTQAVGTILNDEPVPSITISDASVTEANAGSVNASFTLTLSAASSQTVTVTYTTANGTASAGSDYVAASGTATFAAGTTTQNIAVSVLGDTLDEADETFVMTLSNPTNATVAGAQGAGTIVDDDPEASVTIANVSVTEGNTGQSNAVFAVTLTPASGRIVTVAYTTGNGTAIGGSDYTATSGTLTFNAGTVTQTIAVAVSGDTMDEANETFLVNLSAPTNATLAVAQAIGSITDDDPPPSISIADVAVTEGNAGTVNAVFTATLSAASGQTVTVAYATANGTATAGTDYTAASGTLTFVPGVTSQSITVVVTGDAVTEPAETFVINLATPTNSTIADGQATGTILNDDGNTGLVAAFGFDEGSGTTTLDSSGGGNSATITGATWAAAGRFGRALSFDGVNDWATVNDTASLDVTRVTIEAWVRPSTLSGWRTAVLKEQSNGLAYALYAHDNAPRPSAYINTGGPDREVQGSAALALNTWSHIAVTYDGTTMRLYVNGAQVGTRSVNGTIIATSGALRIGGNAVWGEYFTGLIDEVRIYNRALSQAEIQTDMEAPVNP